MHPGHQLRSSKTLGFSLRSLQCPRWPNVQPAIDKNRCLAETLWFGRLLPRGAMANRWEQNRGIKPPPRGAHVEGNQRCEPANRS